MVSQERLLLSPPRATHDDVEAVVAALESGWLAPVGPELSAFEADMATYLGVAYAVGVSSGTAAIHLGLKYLGVRPGDVVLVPTATFAATAFAVTYVGAEPVFIDIDDSWNLDPAQVDRAIRSLRGDGKRVTAAVPVDLYGTPANYGELEPLLSAAEIPCIEDAAEGLGGQCDGKLLGSFGEAGVISFNGNKIITSSGGGMLATNDGEFAARVRRWSTQARDEAPWYEHSEIGYNYRLSNILAALGRSQLRRVDDEVSRRRQIREWYRLALADVPGVIVQEDPPWGVSNAWLTIVTFATTVHDDAPRRVRQLLEDHNIESRPVWKPMHLQPVFASVESFLDGTAERLFHEGLCLPSGSLMTESDVDRVVGILKQALGV
jgi:dTDP-4-amino-4,6-dideoxygalactose transaminase